MTPLQLCNWARTSLKTIQFSYCTCSEYSEVKEQLQTQFDNSRTITGTHQYHSFIPVSSEVLQVQKFSASITFKEERVSKQDSELDLETIFGYITCTYNNKWWLAYVFDRDVENSEVKVTLLHPHAPSRLYKYPNTLDVLIVPSSNILTKVDPRTTTGHTYTLSKKEKQLAAEKLHAFF